MADEDLSIVDAEQPHELPHGVGVIVDPEVDVAVPPPAVPAALPHDEERRRLPPPAISPGAVRRLEGGEYTVDEIALGPVKRRDHLGDDALPGQDVALAGISVAGAASRPRDAVLARERRGAPARVDRAHLAERPAVVVAEHPVHGLLGGRAAGHQIQSSGAERRVRVGLGGHRTGAGAGPRNDRADRRELRGHGDAPFRDGAIDRHDRERHRSQGEPPNNPAPSASSSRHLPAPRTTVWRG